GAEVWKHEVRDADVRALVVNPAHRVDPHAEIRVLRLDVRRGDAPVQRLVHVAGHRQAVEEREVLRVHVPLVALKIVAILEHLARRVVAIWRVEELIGREEWRLARAKIGKDDSRLLHARIGAMTNPLEKRRARGFAWLIETSPPNVEEPPVVDASEASIFQTAVAEIGAAVRTMERKEPDPALRAKQDKVLPQQSDRQRRAAIR